MYMFKTTNKKDLMKTIETTINFGGFYNSIHDGNIDYMVEALEYNFDNVDLFNDFDSLISILKNLDVFVTVSNSTAHFAGALGVPTILICPKKSSTYYYWDYEDGKTPWYNNISIIKFKDSLDNTMKLVDDLINKI